MTAFSQSMTVWLQNFDCTLKSRLMFPWNWRANRPTTDVIQNLLHCFSESIRLMFTWLEFSVSKGQTMARSMSMKAENSDGMTGESRLCHRLFSACRWDIPKDSTEKSPFSLVAYICPLALFCVPIYTRHMTGVFHSLHYLVASLVDPSQDPFISDG
jgi:hypothetical protein